MTEFEVYLTMGFFHIVAWEGIDHILFLTVLAAVYEFKNWRKILILVTAFTIGHSITLMLATLDYVYVNRDFIEVLIPFTIFITAVFNILPLSSQKKKGTLSKVRYASALFFGLIHGLAFAGELKALFALSEESIVEKLLAFNIGIELGQILIVWLVIIHSVVFIREFRQRHALWNFSLSSIAGIASIIILINKFI